MQRALYELFPSMRNFRRKNNHDVGRSVIIRDELESTRPGAGYFVVVINSMGRSTTLIELVTNPYSASHNVRRSLIREFPSHTVCASVILRGRGAMRTRTPSPMTLMVVRRVSHSNKDD